MASFLRPVSMLISEDLPTLDRPMKANSGSFCLGFCVVLVLLPAKLASVIVIGVLLKRVQI